MAQVKVISEQTVLSSAPGRAGKQDLWVLYQMGDDAGHFDPSRTFQTFVPYEDALDPVTKQVKPDVVATYIKDSEARRVPANPRTFHL
jgi:hypothetical protein